MLDLRVKPARNNLQAGFESNFTVITIIKLRFKGSGRKY